MRINTSVAVKSVVATLVLIICIVVTKLYEPVVGAKFAVEQLNEDYSSHAGLRLWELFEEYWGLGYVLLLVAMFANDIKKLFIR